MGYGDAYICAVVINDYQVEQANEYCDRINELCKFLGREISDDQTKNESFRERWFQNESDYGDKIEALVKDCCSFNRAVVIVVTDDNLKTWRELSNKTYQPIPVTRFLEQYKDRIWNAESKLKEFKLRHLILMPCHHDNYNEFLYKLGRSEGGGCND